MSEQSGRLPVGVRVTLGFLHCCQAGLVIFLVSCVVAGVALCGLVTQLSGETASGIQFFGLTVVYVVVVALLVASYKILDLLAGQMKSVWSGDAPSIRRSWISLALSDLLQVLIVLGATVFGVQAILLGFRARQSGWDDAMVAMMACCVGGVLLLLIGRRVLARWIVPAHV